MRILIYPVLETSDARNNSVKKKLPKSSSFQAKHEIVKSNEQNGVPDGADVTKGSAAVPTGSKHAPASAAPPLGASGTLTTNNSNQNSQSSAPVSTSSGKRGSSGHRRDKTSRDKHGGYHKLPGRLPIN